MPGYRVRCGRCGCQRRDSELVYDATIKDLACVNQVKCQHAREIETARKRNQKRQKRAVA